MWKELKRVLLVIGIYWTCASADNCLPEWLKHDSSCYKKEVTPNGWLGARHHCVWQGGDLLSITTSAEEDFVKRTMGNTRFWLGLSNQKCDDVWCRFEGGSQNLTWSDGENTTHTNWAPNQLESADVASCAYVNQGAYRWPGGWRSGSCASSLAYMCKRPLSCPDGQTCTSQNVSAVMKTSDCNDGNLLYGDDCYLFDATSRTWEDAEKFCLARRGHLTSIHSRQDAGFIIDHSTSYFTWVGEKKKGNNYEWTDGTPSNDYGQYYYYSHGVCSGLYTNYDLFRRLSCSWTHPPVCKTAKRGGPPQLPPFGQPDWTEKCGWWLDYPTNDFCYLMIREPTKTWQEAQDDCQRLQGNLLSIADRDEQIFVHGYIKGLTKASSLWLGANVSIQDEGSKWVDGSLVHYVYSALGTAAGNCLSFLTGNSNWEYDSCDEKRGYVCKKRGKVVKATPAPESNKCAPGWLEHDSSCYKKVEEPNGWVGAWHHCVWLGGNLLSVTSSAEENFVKSTMGEDTPFWLGLSNQKCDKFWCRFEGGSQNLTWSDDQTTTHRNWASNQLESADVASCAYVNQGGKGDPGKWRSGSCLSSLAYVCKRPLNCPTCSPKSGPAIVTTSDCHDNTFHYGDYCYHYEKTVKTFEDAEKFCLARGGHLASVHSQQEAQFVYDHSQTSQSAFVGLKKEDDDEYEWSDGTTYKYDGWEDGDATGNCAFANSVGKLSASSCTTQRPFVCKAAKHGGPQQLPPSIGQRRWTEKCGWWLDDPTDDFCYLFKFQATKTWQQAQAYCKGRQGNLLSIADSLEQRFVHGIAKTLIGDDASLWLGASASIEHDGGKWADGSPFSYLHSSAGVTEGGKCLSLLTGSGDWERDKCDNKKGYVCKKRGKGKPAKPQLPHDGYKKKLLCQDDWKSLECPDERVIRIRSAFHGRKQSDVCPSGGGSRDDCRVEGALSHFRGLCDNYQICPIYPSDTDSCPGVSKYVHVVYSCEKKVCLNSLGIADGRIPDSNFSASSSAINAEPHKARLGGSGCWRPSEMFGSWIQVNLGQNFKVTGIEIQKCTYQWQSVGAFAMQFSIDGMTWYDHPKQPSAGTYILTRSVFTQYVRLLPLDGKLFLGLRFDVLGCTSDDSAHDILCSSRATDLSLDGPMTVRCPLGCAQARYRVYGTRIYDQDSNICAAAIHSGVIEIGGDVTLLKGLPQKVYNGSTCNGITSKVYGDEYAPSPSYTFADTEPRCLGPDWEEFADFCYKRFDDTKKWHDAQQSCRSLDANLVSIRSEAEQDWLHELVKHAPGDTWTGLNDLVNLGRFVWSDRREVTFTNWAPGKPTGLMENCVATLSQSGKWKMVSCMELNGYVCKMPTAR